MENLIKELSRQLQSKNGYRIDIIDSDGIEFNIELVNVNGVSALIDKLYSDEDFYEQITLNFNTHKKVLKDVQFDDENEEFIEVCGDVLYINELMLENA